MKIIVFPLGCSYRQRLEAWLAERGIVAIGFSIGTWRHLGCVAAGIGSACCRRRSSRRPAPRPHLAPSLTRISRSGRYSLYSATGGYVEPLPLFSISSTQPSLIASEAAE